MQSKHYTSTDQKKPFLDHGRKTGKNLNRQSTKQGQHYNNNRHNTARKFRNWSHAFLKQQIELFQAGRTKSCLPIWRSLTSDREILATVSGPPIELEGEIPLELRTHNCSQAQ